MTIALLIAAALTLFIGLLHSVLGEQKLIGPLLAPAKRTGMLERSWFARAVLRFAWHVTSLAWWGLGAVMASIALAAPASQMAAVLISCAATFLITGLYVLIAGRGRHHAWIVFLAIGILAMVPLF